MSTLEYQEHYYHRRKKTHYLRQVEEIVNECDNCVSMLDVGGGHMGFLFRFDYPQRTLVDSDDIQYFPGNPEDIDYIKRDFLTVDIPQHDIVTCLQVIEQVDQKHLFAQKLYDVARKCLIVSIPYLWDVGDHHDGLNESHILDWFPVPPDRVISSPNIKKCNRLICVWYKEQYHENISRRNM